jgi:hypothetical protein
VDVSKRTHVIIWTSIAATAAGILAVVAMAKWRERALTEQRVTSRLRNIRDVLQDFHRKIGEIEDHLPAPRPLPRSSERIEPQDATVSNGNPAPKSA